MFGLAVVLFFSVTGITLNHPDWFDVDVERSVEHSGALDPRWVMPADPGDSSDPVDRIARLEVVEHLRERHGVRGALAAFTADESTCVVSFKGPGYAADAFINRVDGRYTLTVNQRGLVAVINDLHKGRDSGPAWSLLIDVSAVLLTAASLTGLVLLLYLKRRRLPGLVTAVVGALAVGLVVYCLVP